MGLLERAIADTKRITENASKGFGTAIIVTNREGDSFSVFGLHNKHHLGIDSSNGDLVNSKKASMSITESTLVTAGCVTRNADKEVDLTDFILDVADSSGESKKYIVKSCFADETIGLLTMILDDHA